MLTQQENEMASVLLMAMTNAMKANSKELAFRNESGYMGLVRQVVDWIFQYCNNFDLEWFMNPATFPAAVREEEHAIFKTARFKKMLQIDFSNEYAAGFRLLHFFCLELQASAFNQDQKFVTVMSEALAPEMFGGLYSDPNKTAREFLLRSFIKPYLIEATTNQAAKVFLEPVLDALVPIFRIQQDYRCFLTDKNVEPALDILSTIQNFLWFNIKSILSKPNLFTDYWVWKCINTYFRIGSFLAQAYIDNSVVQMQSEVEDGLIAMVNLSMFVLIHLVCKVDRCMPEQILAPEYSTEAISFYYQEPDTSALTFYKPIVSSFISQVTFDGLLNIWQIKGLVVHEASFDTSGQKAQAQAQIYEFLRLISALPCVEERENAVVTHLWENHGNIMLVLNSDSRLQFRYLSLLKPRYVPERDEDMNILEEPDESDLGVGLTTCPPAMIMDDFIL